MLKVTFIMPVYNAGKYLMQAIRSLQAQTIHKWLLIIVDDKSTDNSLDIARKCAREDDRISIIERNKNSGNAFLPRWEGIQAATTEFVSPLDADDWVAPDYLETLIADRESVNADLIYPTFYRSKSIEDVGRRFLPMEDQIYQHFFPGKDTVILTLDQWKIAACGGLTRKSIYEEAVKMLNTNNHHILLDEVLTRLLLFRAGKVAFSKARYYYRENPNSITSVNIHRFDTIKRDLMLYEFITGNFHKDSDEYRLLQKQMFHTYMDSCVAGTRLSLNTLDRENLKISLHQIKQLISSETLKSNHIRWIYRLMLKLHPALTGHILRLKACLI